MEKNKAREIAIHVVSALLFILLPILFAPGPRHLSEVLSDPHTGRDLLSSGLMLLFFYSNFFYFIPQFYFREKYFQFALVAFFFLVLIALLPPMVFPFGVRGPRPGHGPGGPPDMGDPEGGIGYLFFEIGHQFFFFAATLLLSLSIRLNDRWRMTEKEKMSAEISYLRAQINPHFLFNTLNSIYSLAIEKSDKTPEAVVKLSGMMRYVLSEAHNERVSLEREIAYIGDYIELQKIRLGHTVRLSYTFSGNTAGKQIAPLVLIPFVENAFKHGVNAEEKSEITIHTQVEGDRLTLEVINNKVGAVLGSNEKSGLGIENTRNRLLLFYPNRHELIIRDGESIFSVVLKINLA